MNSKNWCLLDTWVYQALSVAMFRERKPTEDNYFILEQGPERISEKVTFRIVKRE
jgi:hypothetical protein